MTAPALNPVLARLARGRSLFDKIVSEHISDGVLRSIAEVCAAEAPLLRPATRALPPRTAEHTVLGVVATVVAL